MNATRDKLLAAAAQTLQERGASDASARAIAGRAGVNQALIFYHFGTVNELLDAACRRRVEEAVAHYREQFSAVGSLSELLAVGRALHVREREVGNVALMAQLMSGANSDPVLRGAARYGMDLWIADIHSVLSRVLRDSPLADVTDVAGLARAVTAAFVGIELYEGVDAAGAGQAIDALERLAVLVEVVNDLGPVARRALKNRLGRARASGR